MMLMGDATKCCADVMLYRVKGAVSMALLQYCIRLGKIACEVTKRPWRGALSCTLLSG